MPTKPHNLLSRAAGWVLARPELMLLLAEDEALAVEPPQRFQRAWFGLAVSGVLWGIVLTAVWGAAWKTFGHYLGFLIMPAAITVAFYCLLPFAGAVSALARQIGGASADRRSAAASVIVVALALCFIHLSPDRHRWELFDLPWWIEWLRPQDKLYRVLLLMPAWGSWAMLISLKICKPGEKTEPQVAALARGCDAIAVTVIMAVLLAASIAYFHHLGVGGQIAVPAVAIVAAVASGSWFCRASGGLSRQSLLAANLATQIAFLAAYLAGR